MNAGDLQVFLSQFEGAFPLEERQTTIESVIVAADAFATTRTPAPEPLTEFLAQLTSAAGGKVPAAAQDKVRKNLEWWPSYGQNSSARLSGTVN